MRLADRMDTIKPYFFAELGVRITELQAQGIDVIRLDAGSPDMPPSPFIVQELQIAADKPDRHGYSLFGGSLGFRKAVANYYARHFEVTLNPQSEVVGLIGSKEGLFHLSMAFLNPGDVALVPDPGYAVYSSAARFAGAEVATMPLLEKNHFLPDLSAIPVAVRQRAKLLWLNYPNNPTGGVASEAFFTQLINFAHTHQILVCHDAPYLHVTYDTYQASSLLQLPGAREVTIEFNSLSKTYNMAGWRLGMACGHAPAIAALHSLKSNLDSSHFLVVQDAGIAALTGDQSWLSDRNAVYQVRRDIVLNGLSQVGLIAHKPQAAMYVWSRIPEGTQSGEFTRKLLEETGVSVTPGSFFGTYGEGYFRISLSTPTPRVEEAMKRISAWV